MSDQKFEDDITRDKTATEEEDMFASLQDDFDTLLANETCDSIDHLDALDDEYKLPLDIQANSGVKDDLDALEIKTLSTEKSTEREPIEAEFFADINASTMPNRANESIPVAAPPPRPVGKSKWVSLSFITISLAAISLAFWLKLIPIDLESEIATNSSADMIATPSPAPIQRPKAVATIKPAQSSQEQKNETAKADMDKIHKEQQQPGHKRAVAVPVEKVVSRKDVSVSAAEEASKLVSSPITPATSVGDTSAIVVLAKNKPEAHKNIVGKSVSKPAKPTSKPVPAVSKITGGNNNWAVVLSSVSSEKAAIQQQARMRVRGVNTQYVQSLNDGRLSYLIHVGGFSNRLEAEKQISILSKKLGLRDAWVNRL